MSDSRLWDQFVANARSAAASLRVKSALNPMLWLSAIISPICLTLAYFAHGIEPLATWLLFIGAAPIVATIFGFFYFMIFDAGRLQSEEYQIRHETLELIRQKGTNVEVAPSSLEAITNPIRAISARHES
jgi:hypothetical protein